jgi:hypothetical protein
LLGWGGLGSGSGSVVVELFEMEAVVFVEGSSKY